MKMREGRNKGVMEGIGQESIVILVKKKKKVWNYFNRDRQENGRNREVVLISLSVNGIYGLKYNENYFQMNYIIVI